MSWESVVLDQLSPDADLASAIDRLFAEQRANWAALRSGEAALATIQTKTLTDDGAKIVVQANPGRKKSTHAKTDPQSVARRPCFLCPENMPHEERGIAFGEMVILPNPYPVLPRHCTIPERTHGPQRLQGRVAAMLALARAVGPEMLVFYNGPRCGASAPDHFHFQACDASGIPLLEELPLSGRSAVVTSHASFDRRMLVFAAADADSILRSIQCTLGAMQQFAPADEEPMLNLLTIYRERQYVSVLFPRAAHRPACYFGEGPEQLAISPAALEMAGLLVVAQPEHFDRVDGLAARGIYAEVSLDQERFARLEQKVL